MGTPASGTVVIRGCFSISFSYNFTYRFAEGSIVYLVYKAQKGVLEKVAIKEVRLVSNSGVTIPQYIDTYNATYFDEDLCVQTDAISLATTYLQNRLNEVNNIIGQLSC